MKQIPRQEMPVQDPDVRNRNFEEVALGYDEELALVEASRCLGCRKPLCVKGCPVDVPIPEFIALVKEKKYLTQEKWDKIYSFENMVRPQFLQ